jgi:hypothetical protein
VLFAMAFHPDELLPNRSALYTMESVRKNLAALVRTSREAGWAVEFVRSERLRSLWDST